MAKKIQNPQKKKAWDMFSRLIRVRDCLETTGVPFVGVCITCGRRFHISYLEAGHCLPGRTNAKLFDKNLVHAQCKYCNQYKHGERKKYEAAMRKKYGDDEFEQMKLDAKRIIPDNDIDFIELAEEFLDEYRQLMHTHGYQTWLELLKEGK